MTGDNVEDSRRRSMRAETFRHALEARTPVAGTAVWMRNAPASFAGDSPGPAVRFRGKGTEPLSATDPEEITEGNAADSREWLYRSSQKDQHFLPSFEEGVPGTLHDQSSQQGFPGTRSSATMNFATRRHAASKPPSLCARSTACPCKLLSKR
jgi:hypothetical protein